jgi:hypothetical protein
MRCSCQINRNGHRERNRASLPGAGLPV